MLKIIFNKLSDETVLTAVNHTDVAIKKGMILFGFFI